jgi:hypothetical protein
LEKKPINGGIPPRDKKEKAQTIEKKKLDFV